MSRRKGKYVKQKRKKYKGLHIAVCVLTILLIVLIIICFMLHEDQTESFPPEPQQTEGKQTEEEQTEGWQTVTTENEPSLPLVQEDEKKVNLEYGLCVTDIGSYTGMYMEDGSDEILSGILMLVVQNDSQRDIQYARIDMPVGDETASFTLTTLPAGEKVVLLESSRMQWDETVDYDQVYPLVENIAYFNEPIGLEKDRVKTQIVNGAINVTNISGQDIAGTITVYYKNASADLYYGGITYRVSVEGGLKAEELRQVMTNHASDTGSKIVFVTIAQ